MELHVERTEGESAFQREGSIEAGNKEKTKKKNSLSHISSCTGNQ